jgi:hypothetical protein
MKFALITLLSLTLGHVNAQHTEHRIDSTEAPIGLLRFFLDGHLHGNIRNFTMSTINKGELNDYYANAMGASIHYETGTFKGFKLGLNGIFVHRIFSNDLNKVDSTVGKSSSYEKQLFDVEHPENYNDLDRLEELYVNYSHKGFDVTLGKMEIETPMIHIHDGRMKPKVFSGVWYKQQLNKSSKLSAGWFTKASPRSTTHWYSISDAIGIYGNGCLPDGSPAEYHEHLTSKGLGIFGVNVKRIKNLELNAWNYYLDNISNSVLLKVDWIKDSSIIVGGMYLYQLPIRKGGSNDIEHTFYRPDEVTHVFSSRIGYHFKWGTVSLSGTKILNSGRYVFPREFGVDPFYTFISRSQLEGLGDAEAIDLKYSKSIKQLEFNVDWNRVLSSSSFSRNKYNLPSYDQFNIDMTYSFHKKMEGLKIRLLYVYRDAIGKVEEVKQQFNKVDFHQINLVANFNF